MNLLEELIDYANFAKANSVYWKCLRLGKTNLANKIAQKYKIKTAQDDCVMAFGLALMVKKKINGNIAKPLL